MNYTLIEKGMQDILDRYTPYKVGDKEYYELKDVLKMLESLNAQVTKKLFYSYDPGAGTEYSKQENIEQYPESSC